MLTTAKPSNEKMRDDQSVEVQSAIGRSGNNRVVLRTYDNYVEAQQTVDFLSDNKFPVEKTAIVARGLSYVENVTGRLWWGKMLCRGMCSGALMGTLIGCVLGLFVFNPVTWLALLLWSAGVGSLFGGLFAMIGYWSLGGRRDFDSVSTISADQFDVVVEREAKGDAETVLARLN